MRLRALAEVEGLEPRAGVAEGLEVRGEEHRHSWVRSVRIKGR